MRSSGKTTTFRLNDVTGAGDSSEADLSSVPDQFMEHQYEQGTSEDCCLLGCCTV
jgi:hypothetical protein